jgi:hypothetical protein
MKQEENNEIETLLRNVGRRHVAQGYSAESEFNEDAAKGAHLDVDELNCYAERALPPSARARCTAHLADCDICRQLVAQLSLAVGPLPDEGSIEADPTIGLTWTQKLSGLFSARMIGYAIPALAVVVIAAAFFGWRQQRREESATQIALNQRVESPAVVRPRDQTASAAPSQQSEGKVANITKPSPKEAATPQGSVSKLAAERTREETASSDEKKEADAVSSETVPAKTAKQAAPAETKEGRAQPTYAPEPPVRAAKPQSVAANQEQQKDQPKNNNIDNLDRNRDTNVQRQGAARNENEVAAQRGPAKREAQVSEKRKAADTGAAAGAGAADDEADIRTVAGRRFRRLSNAWVDTAYKTSMPIRSVTRGSEEYRALVADEPMIAVISGQLGGEVIVVWKSRAYRIY